MGVSALTACRPAQAKEIPAASAQWAQEFDGAQAAQRVRPPPAVPSEPGARTVFQSSREALCMGSAWPNALAW
jgi:hypothetical protein